MAMKQSRDGPTTNEVLRRDNQPTGRMAAPYTAAAPTMKRGTGSFVNSDGINKTIPVTNNTKAPGQHGRS